MVLHIDIKYMNRFFRFYIYYNTHTCTELELHPRNYYSFQLTLLKPTQTCTSFLTLFRAWLGMLDSDGSPQVWIVSGQVSMFWCRGIERKAEGKLMCYGVIPRKAKHIFLTSKLYTKSMTCIDASLRLV